MNEHYDAVAFFNYAHSYACSARTLYEARTKVTHSSAPIYFLCFHALEMYLKSYLLAHNFTKRDLRKREYGHNILRIAQEAEVHGLILADVDKQVISLLSKTDNIISSRYFRRGIHQRIEFKDLWETCCRIHLEICPDVYSGVSTTRRPLLPPI